MGAERLQTFARRHALSTRHLLAHGENDGFECFAFAKKHLQKSEVRIFIRASEGTHFQPASNAVTLSVESV